MERKRGREIINNRGIEENTMAILDSFSSHDSSHLHDDRLAFLEAVRFASIVPKNSIPPTSKMMEAIFEIFRESHSLELIIASFQLLVELEKHFPRAYILDGDDIAASSSKSAELIVVEEAWSPIFVGTDVASRDKNAMNNRRSKESIDAVGFHRLLQSLGEVYSEAEPHNTKLELLADMLLFQYLILVLEVDFMPRNHAFLENMSWSCLRESLLNKLLGSRRINYKAFVNDCLFLLCNAAAQNDSGHVKSSSANEHLHSDAALALCLPEFKRITCASVKKLIIMIMEFDFSRKVADTEGLTARADGAKTPVVELIMDTLSYNRDLVSPFLQVFDHPKWKLQIVSEYLQKYTAKPSTRNRSNGSQDDGTLTGIFKSFTNNTSTKSIVKKVGPHVIQVLLAHALKACMSLPQNQLLEGIPNSKEYTKDPLLSICKNIIAAFTRLRETYEGMEILPIGKEALFAAETIVSVSS